MKLALIGVGRWGNNIRRTLDDIEEAELTHICSTDKKELNALPRRYTKIKDYKELLKTSDLDAVLIATPGSTHARIALPFIEKGIPTYIEKPFTTSLKDAKRLETAAKKNMTITFVGHIHLFNPAYLKTKELTKTIGTIRTIRFAGANNGPFRDDMSALWDWGPHGLSLITDILKTNPTNVQAWGQKILRPKTDLYDTVSANFSFKNNTTGYCHFSWLSPRKKLKLTIIGSKHTLIFDDTKPDRKITLYKDMGPTIKNKQLIQQQPVISYPKYSQASPLTEELKAFIEAVKTKKQPLTNATHALNNIKTLSAIEKSSGSKGRLTAV